MTEYNLLEGNSLFDESAPIYLNIVIESPRENINIHQHDFIEIAYVNSGRGIHLINGQEYSVAKGDLVIINYGIPHVFMKEEVTAGLEKESKLIVYNCVFRPEFVDYSQIDTHDFMNLADALLQNTAFSKNVPFISLKLSGSNQIEIESIYHKMQSEYFSKPNGYLNLLKAYLVEMLIKLFRMMNDQKSMHLYSNKSSIIHQSIDLLNSNPDLAEIRMDELAMKAYLSKSYFSKLFKGTTGQKFSEYVQNLKITEACSMLKTTDKKVIDIMNEAGFKDTKHFNRIFKKITGVTPSEYRKMI